MKISAVKIIFALLLALPGVLWLSVRSSQALYRASDRISSSWPGGASDHSIQFINKHEIPAGGSIVVDFDDAFSFESGFDYTDMDLAIADAASGPFTDRDVSSSSALAIDGISVSTSSVSIQIRLASGSAIPAGRYVSLELGQNAGWGQAGDRRLINPPALDSYRIAIESRSAGGALIESATVSIVTVSPVAAGGNVRFRYLGASPVGWLSYGTTETIMSLNTNYPARCRYGIASSTSYDLLTDSFTYASSTAYYFYHTVILSGLTNGGDYDYYIRCRDSAGNRDIVHECNYSTASTTPFFDSENSPILNLDCTDYYIPFSITSQAGDGESGGSGGEGSLPDVPGSGSESGSGSGSGSGGGGGGGMGRDRANYLPYPPPPGEPGVVFSGWAYPKTEVRILRDGVEIGKALAGDKADFGAFWEVSARGVYTFTLWASDSAGRKSNNFSTTFWMEAGTQTTVSGIILAPTMSLKNSSVIAGQFFECSGQSAPGATIEIWLYPDAAGTIQEDAIVKKSGAAGADGTWSLYAPTEGLTDGSYLIKARTQVSGTGASDFSQAQKVSIGPAPVREEEAGLCSGADLNRDGRVNLTDFSILLYHWGTNNECADQNHDGTVNLTDFSIMLFHWTG